MTHAALKDRLALVRDALKPIPWAKGEAGNPSMADTVQEAIAALSAMEGEAVAWEVAITGLSGNVYRFAYVDRPNPEAFGPNTTLRPLIYGDTAPPPQQAATCHNCGVQCYGWHRCPPAHQPGEVVTGEMVERAYDEQFNDVYADSSFSRSTVRKMLLAALAPKEAG